jgi:hypothetical protein
MSWVSVMLILDRKLSRSVKWLSSSVEGLSVTASTRDFNSVSLGNRPISRKRLSSSSRPQRVDGSAILKVD